MTSFVNALFAVTPFDTLKDTINVHRVDVSSTDSGADDPTACGGTGAVVRTYFDASFCNSGARRALVVNSTTAIGVANAQVPAHHAVMVIVNSAVYGGTGGSVACFSLAAGANEIGIHEMGHSAYGLADEYEYYLGCGVDTNRNNHPAAEPAEPNVTINSHRDTMKWRDLVAAATAMPTTTNANCSACDPQASPVPARTVGTFEGAHYYHCGAFRPEFNCRMRALGNPFCAVCERRIREVMAPFGRTFQARVLETATTFGDETDGTWMMADWDRDGIPDLVYIKTANTPNGLVEVHVASGASNYQTRVLEVETTFANETDGTWTMADWDGDGIPDLVFIKTANTPSGNVEVHIASGASNYQTRVLETATTFANEDDGTWMMADWDRDGIPDLVFIKTANTPSGNVEVHIASGASNYQTRVIETATTFANESDGTWTMADWDGDGIRDLAFIKTANTPSGQVEVHVASGASDYQTRVLEVETTFANETDGTWLLADWNGDGVPDLVFVKTAHTPTGFVEVHVAQGRR